MKQIKPCFLLSILFIFSTPVWSEESPDATSIQQLEQLVKTEKGNVIYIDFWASWCIPCRKSFPWLNSLKAQYQDQGLTILSVNLDHSKTLADAFLAEIPANFPVIYDPKGLIAKKYQLKGMPSSFIINRKGKIVSAHVGFNQKKQLSYEAEIKALLSNSVGFK